MAVEDQLAGSRSETDQTERSKHKHWFAYSTYSFTSAAFQRRLQVLHAPFLRKENGCGLTVRNAVRGLSSVDLFKQDSLRTFTYFGLTCNTNLIDSYTHRNRFFRIGRLLQGRTEIIHSVEWPLLVLCVTNKGKQSLALGWTNITLFMSWGG